jgi:hypothetical protein
MLRGDYLGWGRAGFRGGVGADWTLADVVARGGQACQVLSGTRYVLCATCDMPHSRWLADEEDGEDGQGGGDGRRRREEVLDGRAGGTCWVDLVAGGAWWGSGLADLAGCAN